MHFLHRRSAGSAPTPSQPPGMPACQAYPHCGVPVFAAAYPFSQGMIRARHLEAQAEQAWGLTLVTLPRRASVRLVRRLGRSGQRHAG
jgi:hypothetical protein